LSSIALWHSAPSASGPSSEGAQKYHFDLAYPKWLCVFVYLSDVDADKGPHCFVKSSHKRDLAGSAIRNRGIDRVSDEDIEAAYGRERIAEICGPAGTLFFADTRAFHKGRAPRKGERLMLNLVYANSQAMMPIPQRPFDPIDKNAVQAINSAYPRYFDVFKPR